MISLIVACGELPTLSEGPREDEDIFVAFNHENFIKYVVQSNHKNEQLGQYFTTATISPIDLSFKTKTKQLLFTTEHSSYYFDRVDDSYDIYYKDKLIANETYIGNSFYGRYNRIDIIEGIPTIDDIFSYYNVFDITSLSGDDFTYNLNLNGWYYLNTEAYSKIITNFFALDNTHTLEKFNVQVSENHLRSIQYEINSPDGTISNELFYTYPLDYLQDDQFSLINALEVTKVERPLDITITSDDISSEPTSEEEPMTSDGSDITSESPSSDEPLTSDEPNSEESNGEQEIEYVDKVSFAIYDDAKIFGTNRYTIESIQLFENYDYETTLLQTPLKEIERGDNENVTTRSLTLDRRLTRGNRYLLRINLGSSPNGTSSDYYDYAWIY